MKNLCYGKTFSKRYYIQDTREKKEHRCKTPKKEYPFRGTPKKGVASMGEKHYGKEKEVGMERMELQDWIQHCKDMRDELQPVLAKALEVLNTLEWAWQGGVAHETIKAELYAEGKRRGHYLLPEYRLWAKNKSMKQIDLVWLDSDKHYAAAFEIDKALSIRSLEKLQFFRARCPAFIVSFGRSHSMSEVRKRLIRDHGIGHIDVTGILKRR